MFEKLRSPALQQFIRDHEHDDPRQLILKHKTIEGLPSMTVVEQIVGRSKARTKFPMLYANADIVYPPKENLEQSSSEATARFKTEIISGGDSAVDLTGGFGIDSLFLSQRFKTFDYVEQNSALRDIARHNHLVLGATNIHHHLSAAEIFLSTMGMVDLVFIDPSRRISSKKVFTLEDSQPEILLLQTEIFQKSTQLLVKASPLLDIKLACRQLMFVKKVFVVAVEDEVKELLFLSEKDHAAEPEIHAVNLAKSTAEIFSFRYTEEEPLVADIQSPRKFLFEPNAAILKAGAFKSIGKKYGLAKVDVNTHLYSSDLLVADFPGRGFEIIAEVKPDRKVIAELVPEGQANVVTRNYPLTSEELKKKIGLRDGGEKFVIGFSTGKKKMVVVANRVG